MRTSIKNLSAFLILFASVAWSQVARSEEILIRTISATWCGPCNSLIESMQNAKMLGQGKNGYYKGETLLKINGKTVKVQLETVEIDIKETENLKLNPPIDKSEVKYYPTSQLYVNKTRVMQENYGELAKQLNSMIDWGDLAGTFVNALETYIAQNPSALTVKAASNTEKKKGAQK